MMRRLLAAGAAALMLAAGLSLSTASAAQLQVFTGLQTSFNDASACAPAMSAGQPVIQATASGTPSGGQYSQIQLSAVPAACQGLERQVFVHDASGAPIASGTAAAGATAVDVGPYTPSDDATVVTKFGGWIFPTEWTAPTPPSTGPAVVCEALNPGGQLRDSPSCSVTVTPNGGPPWGYDNGSTMSDFTFHVSWDSPPQNKNWKWRVTFDLSQPPFPGFTPQWVGVNDNPGLILSEGYACSGLPELSFTSTSRDVWGGHINIGDGAAPSYFSGQSFCG